MKLLIPILALSLLALELTWALLESLLAPDRAKAALAEANGATVRKHKHP
jgi:hypothetical protein